MYSEVLLTVCRESVHSWNIILTSTMQWLITECPLQCSSRRSVSSSSHCFLLCSLHEQYELCFVSNYSTVIDRIVWRIQIFTTVLALPIGCWSRCLRWLAVCLYFCTVSVGYCEFNCQHQCNWLREERQFWLCRPPLVFLVSVWVHSFCSWFMEHFLDVQNWSNNITCITVTDYAGIVSFGCVLLHLTTKLQFLVFCKSSSFVVVVVCWFGLCSNFYVSTLYLSNRLPSVLWHCWLGSRNSIWPVKNLSGGVLSWLSARCRLAYHPADAAPLTVSCFSEIQIGFTFLIPAHPDGPEQRAIKWMCVCVYLSHRWLRRPGAQFTKHLTIYWKIILGLL